MTVSVYYIYSIIYVLYHVSIQLSDCNMQINQIFEFEKLETVCNLAFTFPTALI